MQDLESAETPTMDFLVSPEQKSSSSSGDDPSQVWSQSDSEYDDMSSNVPGGRNPTWFTRQALNNTGLRRDCIEQAGDMVTMDVPYTKWIARRCSRLHEMPPEDKAAIKAGRNDEARKRAKASAKAAKKEAKRRAGRADRPRTPGESGFESNSVRVAQSTATTTARRARKRAALQQHPESQLLRLDRPIDNLEFESVSPDVPDKHSPVASEHNLPNWSCNYSHFGINFAFFMNLFILLKNAGLGMLITARGFGGSGPGDSKFRPDAWLEMLSESLQEYQPILKARIKDLEVKSREAKENSLRLRKQAREQGRKAADQSFTLTHDMYMKLEKVERAKYRASDRLEALKNTYWQYVLLLAEHSLENCNGNRESHESWWHVGPLPTIARLKDKFLQQQKCVQVLLRFQPFRQFVISVIVLDGYIYLVWQDRSSIEISEPLNINKEEHETFLLNFFYSLIVVEMPELTGIMVATETINLEVPAQNEAEPEVGVTQFEPVKHSWSFEPTDQSQWKITVTKQRGSESSKRTFVTEMEDDLPPFIQRESLLGRNVFTCKVKELNWEDIKDLFIKFDWARANVEAESPELPGIVLSGEIDHLRLHMELKLHGRLEVYESGKLLRTQEQDPDLGGVPVEFSDSDARQLLVDESRSLCSGTQPRRASSESRQYVQRQACVIITDYTKTFETKLQQEPEAAREAFLYWIQGAIAYNLLVHEITGFIQGDFNFGNLRYNGEDPGDYHRQLDLHTTIGDWDLAETMEPASRLNQAHWGTPLFMAADSLPNSLCISNARTFRKLLYHDLEAFFWGFCISTLRCLEHDAMTRCGIPTTQHDEHNWVTEVAKVMPPTIEDTTVSLAPHERSREDEELADNVDGVKDRAKDLEKAMKAHLSKTQQELNDYEQLYSIFRTLRNCSDMNAQLTFKHSIQSATKDNFRGMWPYAKDLKELKLPEIYGTICDILTNWHVILNCELKEQQRDESDSYAAMWDNLYRLKKEDAESGGEMAKKAARRMLEALCENKRPGKQRFAHSTSFMRKLEERIKTGKAARRMLEALCENERPAKNTKTLFAHGTSFMRKLEERIKTGKSFREEACRNFLRKYPECARNVPGESSPA